MLGQMRAAGATVDLSPISVDLSPISVDLSPISVDLSPISVDLSPISKVIGPRAREAKLAAAGVKDDPVSSKSENVKGVAGPALMKRRTATREIFVLVGTFGWLPEPDSNQRPDG
jgi:hypothetical protein